MGSVSLIAVTNSKFKMPMCNCGTWATRLVSKSQFSITRLSARIERSKFDVAMERSNGSPGT